MDGIGRRCKHLVPKILGKFQITPQLCTMISCMYMVVAKIAVTAMRTCTVWTLRPLDGSILNSTVKSPNQEMSTLETSTKIP